MKNVNYYSQSNHAVLVAASDGSFRRPIGDFAEGDDTISFEPMGERVAVSQGFDKSSLSFGSGDGGTIKIKLKPTSKDVGFLNGLFNRQRSSPTMLDIMITTGVNDVVVLRNCGIQVAGATTGGPTMQVREFSFIGTQIDYDESEG